MYVCACDSSIAMCVFKVKNKKKNKMSVLSKSKSKEKNKINIKYILQSSVDIDGKNKRICVVFFRF